MPTDYADAYLPMMPFCAPVFGLPASVPPPVRSVEPASPVPARSNTGNAPARHELSGAGRTLVLHYHLFKNAGTSIDAILEYNFRERWVEQEFRTPHGRSNAPEVAAYLRENPHLSALSSHTALLPAPQIEGLRVFPIVFLRHPIDRIRSAYVFERKQQADTFGARLAKQTDFAGYVKELLDHPINRSARSFQTHRLAFNEPAEAGSEHERAVRALATLPFVGLVEEYDLSVERLREMLLPYYPDFAAIAVRKNVTRPHTDPLDARLAEVRQELEPALYARLCEANADDIRLFEVVSGRYAARCKDMPAANATTEPAALS